MNLTFISENDNRPEFIGQIVDIFEDFLDEKDIYIPSKDRDDEVDDLLKRGVYSNASDAIAEEGFARIFGSDYDEISGEVEYGLDTDLNIDELIDNIYDGFMRIVKKNEDASVSDKDAEALKDKVRETFVNWKLID